MPAVAGAAFTMAAMLLLCVGCSSESDRAATASPGVVGGKSASHAETIAADYVEAFRDHAELSEQVACLENRSALASSSDVSLDVVPGYHGVPSEPQQAMVAAFDAAGAAIRRGSDRLHAPPGCRDRAAGHPVEVLSRSGTARRSSWRRSRPPSMWRGSLPRS